MPTHRELYPDQYTHPLVGQRITNGTVTGTLERVVASRFGQLAILAEYGAACAWPVQGFRPVEPR